MATVAEKLLSLPGPKVTQLFMAVISVDNKLDCSSLARPSSLG
jgi:hypothetical protein